MRFKKFLLLISSITSISILTGNGILNIHQNITNMKSTNLIAINFKKMSGVSGEINSFAFNNTRNILYAANKKDIYKSTNGLTFSKYLSFSGIVKSVVTAQDGTLYVGVLEPIKSLITIFKVQKDVIIPEYSLISNNLSSLIFDTQGHIYLATSSGVYTSSEVTNQLELIPGTTDNIASLAITKNGLIYAGTNDGKIYKSFGGYPFTLIDQLKNGGITSIAIDNAQTVYVTNESKQVYYLPINFKYFEAYLNPLETTNSTIITMGTGVLVGDTNGNIWKSLRGKEFNKMGITSDVPIKSLIYNSFTFTIFVTTMDGIYKNK